MVAHESRPEGQVLASDKSLIQASRALITSFEAEKQIICAKDLPSPSDLVVYHIFWVIFWD